MIPRWAGPVCALASILRHVLMPQDPNKVDITLH